MTAKKTAAKRAKKKTAKRPVPVAKRRPTPKAKKVAKRPVPKAKKVARAKKDAKRPVPKAKKAKVAKRPVPKAKKVAKRPVPKRPVPKAKVAKRPVPKAKVAKRPVPKAKKAKKVAVPSPETVALRKALEKQTKQLEEQAEMIRMLQRSMQRREEAAEVVEEYRGAGERQDQEARKRALKKAKGRQGKPLFTYCPRKAPVNLSGRPHANLIRAWAARRRNHILTREHDGSYCVTCTFRGENAWLNARRAALKIPAPAIFCFRYLVPEMVALTNQKRRSTSMTPSIYRPTKNGKVWIYESTPQGRARTPDDPTYRKARPVEWLLSMVPNDRHEKLAGLVVKWAPARPPTPKKDPA